MKITFAADKLAAVADFRPAAKPRIQTAVYILGDSDYFEVEEKRSSILSMAAEALWEASDGNSE